jgi:predicted outer membrane repeat protein
MKKTTILFLLLTVPVLALHTYARHVYVKLSTDATAWNAIVSDGVKNVVITLPSGSNDFVTNVLTNLQHGDTVWVAKGTYSITKKLALCDDANGNTYGGIFVYGGFLGTETSVTQRATSDVDGNGLTEPWEMTNETHFTGSGSKTATAGYQMFQLSGTTGGAGGSILDGITLSDHYYGSVTAAGGVVPTSCMVRNCTFRNINVYTSSTSTSNGGVLYVTGGNVQGCLFESCTNTGGGSCYGGAMLIYGIADNTAGTPTGWIKNSMIRNCFAGNTNTGNTATGRGGAIFAKGGVIIENCVIYNNEVAGGNASTNASAIFFHNNGDANKHVNRIIGCTIVLNAGTYAVSSDACLFELYNTVLWGNSSVESPNADGSSYNNTLRFATTTSYAAFPYANAYALEGTVMNATTNKSGISPVMVGAAMNDITTNPDPGFTRPTAYGYPGIAQAAGDIDDIRAANWSPKTGSLLIDAGVDAPSNTTIVTGTTPVSLTCSFAGTDALGVSRSGSGTGSHFDVGAYEYSTNVGTGISLTAGSSVSVVAADKKAYVSGLGQVSDIYVYSVSGSLISSLHATASMASVNVPSKGLYIIKINSDGQSFSRKIAL